MKKLLQTIKNTIPAIAEAMENVRRNMLIFCYQLRHIRTGKRNVQKYLEAAKPELEHYAALVEQIKEKSKERKNLLAEKKDTPIWNIPKAKELASRIAELTEQIEELQTEKNMVLEYLRCADDKGIPAVRKEIALQEESLQIILGQEEKYVAELQEAFSQYAELREQTKELDPVELYEVRQEIRPDKEQDAVRRIQNAYGDRYHSITMFDAKRDTAGHLDEYQEDRKIQLIKRQRQYSARREYQQTQPKKRRDGWER